MPKATTPTSKGRRHNPLESDILGTGLLRSKPASKKRSKSDDEDGEHFIDSKASQKILRIGQELVEEENQENAPEEPSRTAFDIDSRFDQEVQEDDVYEEDGGWQEEDDEEVEEIEVMPEDLETYNKFLGNRNEAAPLRWDNEPAQETESSGVNLADLILRKIQDFEAAAHDASSGKAVARRADDWPDEEDLPPKVVEVYSKVGLILSRWKSGPLPKPIKILPTIPNWERILEVCEPDKFTPNACYALTRIFISAKPGVATRFVEMVLLDRVREDIYETKKLNVHFYNALKKSLYKPAAFFKGFLFPLVGSGTCTLREAQIVGSVLTRVSVPVLHSAAGIKALCEIAAEQPSSKTGSDICSHFIKVLLDKGYALPYQVIDSLVFHFLRPRTEPIPVVFHQSMLSFASRYKNDITEDQRESLLDVLITHSHPAIGPAIRTELLAGRGRGVPLETEGTAFDGDDTMQVDS